MTDIAPESFLAHCVLSIDESRLADRLAIADGTSGRELMENAGRAVADAVLEMDAVHSVCVVCGRGGNGGDGYVAARLLQNSGCHVTVVVPEGMGQLSGDAAAAAGDWSGKTVQQADANLPVADVVVDAVCGAGLSRAFPQRLVDLIAVTAPRCVSVDVPSGVDGNTGSVRGAAPSANKTVTFVRPRPGHLLYPGRARCGSLVIADIGIAPGILAAVQPEIAENHPQLWSARWPWPDECTHKYARGHLAVAGGGMATSGAARLAARAGLRSGAGLVTCVMPSSALMIYALHHTAVMNRPVDNTEEFEAFIRERKVSAIAAGPGQGVSERTRGLVLAALRSGVPVVLDADGLTTFEETPDILFESLHGSCVLTPHEGEFRKLFDRTESRLDDVRCAASKAGCVVILKGPDTVIAAPDGRVLINTNGVPYLATAGSGDVLAGLIGGLLAQGVGPFDAAAMAVWVHADAARRYGPGLVADDLDSLIAGSILDLFRSGRRQLQRDGTGC